MYNSDGYVLIDMSDVDLTRSSQNIPGIYNRVVEVIDTNKLALIINAGNNTPMAAIVHKRLNYYVINTTLFIFTINSNDIVIVEEAGEATVDVSIVPTLTEGTKIADFAIGSVEGSIYAPTQQSEINDNVTASNTTWSSDKINTELSGKANSSDLATVATTGSYSDLTGTPTIPVLTDLIDDTSTAVNKVWSSDKTAAEIAAGAGVTIDDTTTSLTKTWSSDKINTEISAKPSIDDTTASLTTVYSSSKVAYEISRIDTALSDKQKKLSIGEYSAQLNNTAWNGVFYATIDLSASVVNYGTIINAIVIDESENSTFISHTNRACYCQIIATDTIRIYSPEASNASSHYVKIRVTFAK